ncbi:MAG: Mth938-like domain-containing protein [Sphingomonas sp.]
MRFERDKSPDGPLINGFVRGGFRVDENVYRALLLTPNRADGWTPPPLDVLDLAALESVLTGDPTPEFLLLGTGATLIRPPLALVSALEKRGIGVEAMDSRAAARAWGVLRSEGRWITAALYPFT